MPPKSERIITVSDARFLALAGGSLRAGQAYAVNGQRPESNAYLLDGVSNVNRVDGGYALKTPVDAIQEFRKQCDRAVAGNRSTREHVQQLEQQYDATASEERQTLPDGELDSDKLMQELEEFLRKQREGGTQG